MVVISIRLGATALSKTPKRTLVVTRPAQFFAAQVTHTMRPHLANVSYPCPEIAIANDPEGRLTKQTIAPRYFAVGKACMPYA